MKTASKVLFENQHYIVCQTKAGLSVQNKHKGNGKLIPTDHKDFTEWVDSFIVAIDAQESNSLAKAIYETEGY